MGISKLKCVINVIVRAEGSGIADPNDAGMLDVVGYDLSANSSIIALISRNPERLCPRAL